MLTGKKEEEMRTITKLVAWASRRLSFAKKEKIDDCPGCRANNGPSGCFLHGVPHLW
jgi:hypothetical protein